jgi:hypothetical protein
MNWPRTPIRIQKTVLINAFVDGLVAGAVYDYPDVAVEQRSRSDFEHPRS